MLRDFFGQAVLVWGGRCFVDSASCVHGLGVCLKRRAHADPGVGGFNTSPTEVQNDNELMDGYDVRDMPSFTSTAQ